MELVRGAYKVKQIYTNCLAQASYLISSLKKAAIVDPIRDVDQYLKLLKEEDLELVYVIETHFHADFVSGYMDLQKATGCEVIFGPGAKLPVKIRNVSNEEILSLGNIKLQALHTPGHTSESTSFVLIGEKGIPEAVFTGDTLFVGDVGRPDLLDEKSELKPEDQAEQLFNSIHNVLGKLPSECIVFPAHGPGSPCGKKISNETTSTIGKEKETNYAFIMTDKKEFVSSLLDGLTAPPHYFLQNARMNKEGPEVLEELIAKSLNPLSLAEFEEAVSKGAMIIDARSIDEYNEGSIPNSRHHALDGMFAIFVGSIFQDLKQKFVIVAPQGREKEVIVRLNRVGFGGTFGYLEGGIETYKKSGKPMVQVSSVSPDEFAKRLGEGRKLKPEDGYILDVRKEHEVKAFGFKESKNIPLQSLENRVGEISDLKSKRVFVMCGAGYRASIATSILKSNNFDDVVLIKGGASKVKEALEVNKA